MPSLVDHQAKIYATTLANMESCFRVVLAKHKVAIEDFASMGEARWCRILDDMPSRRADMHLRREWAAALPRLVDEGAPAHPERTEEKDPS